MGRKFLSTSSARRTTIARIQVDHRAHISIHVLREEDDQRPAPILALSGISIHVLREEDDRSNVKTLEGIIKFLSTSSARRTTRIRSPERPGTDISIHVLREEDDLTQSVTPRATAAFLSTSSARRTTGCSSRGCFLWFFYIQFCGLLVDGYIANAPYGYDISIHVLREEDDL